MCTRNRMATEDWLQEVQRDPRSLWATRRRIECLLADPYVARSIAARLRRAADCVAAPAALPEPPVRAVGPADCARDRAATPLRDFLLASDGGIPRPARKDRLEKPAPGWPG
jgi:hypothetical protein